MAIKVNDFIISDELLEKEIASLQGYYRQHLSPSEFSKIEPTLGTYAKEKLISSIVIEQEAEKKGYDISSDEVESEYKKLIEYYKKDKEMSSKLNDGTIDTLSIKNKIQKSIMVDKLIKDICKDIPVLSEEELINDYENNKSRYVKPETVRVRHILIKKREDNSHFDSIKDVKSKIDNGESFDSLAKEHSDCSSSTNGGDLGYIYRGQTVPPFEKVAFELSENMVSDPVETEFGVHLIQSVDKKEQSEQSYEDVKDLIKNQLFNIKKNQKINNYLESVKKNYKIDVE